MKLEDVAQAMRVALNEYDEPGTHVTAWADAAPGKREAWLVCARAAFKAIFGTEYPQ
jgi:hypothetical protein